MKEKKNEGLQKKLLDVIFDIGEYLKDVIHVNEDEPSKEITGVKHYGMTLIVNDGTIEIRPLEDENGAGFSEYDPYTKEVDPLNWEMKAVSVEGVVKPKEYIEAFHHISRELTKVGIQRVLINTVHTKNIYEGVLEERLEK